MRKIVLSTLVASTLLMSAEVAVDQVQLAEDIKIAATEADTANAKLKKLKAQLPPNEALMTHTELGYIKTDGNTDTETFMLEADVKKGWDKHKISLAFDAQYGKNDGIVNKKKYIAELEHNYLLMPAMETSLLAGYKKDIFSSYAYQAYAGFGFKYLALKTDAHKLSLEAHMLYSEDQVTDTGTDESNYGAYRAKLDYGWKITDGVKFSQIVTYRAEMDETDNYFIFSKSAITSKISDIFSAGASYKVDYVNIVPADKERTDETFTLNLIIDY